MISSFPRLNIMRIYDYMHFGIVSPRDPEPVLTTWKLLNTNKSPKQWYTCLHNRPRTWTINTVNTGHLPFKKKIYEDTDANDWRTEDSGGLSRL